MQKTVYNFLKKVGSEWRYVVDNNGIPLTLTTDKKKMGSILFLFKLKYPSIASQFRLGETLVAEPNHEDTKKYNERIEKRRREEDDRARSMWWHD